MINYKQVGDSAPKDIEVTTDDGGAEMVKFHEATEDFPASATAVAGSDRGEDGMFVFIIPGDEASELGEVLDMDHDEPSLSAFLEDLNDKLIAEAEGE